jgi:hypothetical protein
MDAGFLCKRSTRSGGKARLTSFRSVSKPLPVLISLMTAGLKGANDHLHYFVRRCFIHGCCPWSSLLVTQNNCHPVFAFPRCSQICRQRVYLRTPC